MKELRHIEKIIGVSVFRFQYAKNTTSEEFATELIQIRKAMCLLGMWSSMHDVIFNTLIKLYPVLGIHFLQDKNSPPLKSEKSLDVKNVFEISVIIS